MSHAGIWIEVQIRSRRMNDIAEKGIAAHWSYKKDGFAEENESEMDKWIVKVKDIIANPDVNALELLDMVHNDLIKTDILVFTPKGEQKSIEKGATALDFAYSIHTEIGNKAIAAKANLRLVPLSYVLKTGDQIEIITAENEKPKYEWLQFAKTRKARSIIMDQLKSERQANMKAGKKMLEDKLDELGYELNDKTLNILMDGLEIFDSKPDEMYYKIAIGLIKLDAIKDILRKWHERPRTVSKENDGHYYIIASCCHPIPGDSVIGFKASDGTITVHKRTCKTANNLAAKFGDRIVIPQWDDHVKSQNLAFLVRLSLNGFDKVGMINEITRYISLVMNVNIRSFSLSTENGVFDGHIELYVHDMSDLDTLIRQLQKIEGIQNVVRTDL